jgi:hypothetical protein
MCVLDSDPKGDKLLYWAAVVIRPRNALVQWISRGRVGSVAAAGESAPGRRGGGAAPSERPHSATMTNGTNFLRKV